MFVLSLIIQHAIKQRIKSTAVWKVT